MFTATIVFGVALLIIGHEGLPKAAANTILKQSECIPDAELTIKTIIDKRVSRLELIAVNPYFPVPVDQRHRILWRMHWRSVSRTRARLIGISERFSKRYRDNVSDYDKSINPAWEKTGAFYRQFHNTDVTMDKRNRKWKLVLKTDFNLFLYPL